MQPTFFSAAMQRFSIPSLTLIATGIAAPSAEAISQGNARWPVLARFASRGEIRRATTGPDAGTSALHPWQASLLETLGLSAAARDYPSAAVSRTGATQEISEHAWGHVQAVHFTAGMSDLSAVLLEGEAGLSTEDRASLMPTLNEHLRAEGYELLSGEHSDWLLRCPRRIDARTLPPEIAFRRTLKESLPHGTNAAELRRLMTEMQMLLHEHPVNAARVRRGLPEANAVWIWGLGTLGSPRAAAEHVLPSAFGSNSYLRGVYLLHDTPLRSQRSDADTLLAADENRTARLAVVEGQDLDQLESGWLVPLVKALRRGSVDTLSLHLDGRQITVRRRDLRRFWRRSLPPARWSA